MRGKELKLLILPETVAICRLDKAGIAVVPGSSFYHRPEDGRDKVRICFAKKWETLRQVRERMEKFLGNR